MEFELVNRDERGEIWKTEIEGIAYWMSYTRQGFGRGGDIHEGWQHNVILKGSFEVRMMVPDVPEGEEVWSHTAFAKLAVPPEVPHVFIALEDSYMMEWHDHELPPFSEKRYYAPYRRLIK